MSIQTIDYPVTPARRRIMVLNVVAHIIAASAAIWFWRTGDGAAWLFFAVAVSLLALWTLVVLLSRPVIARIEGPDTIVIYGATGRETRIAAPEITEMSLDPARRTGVIQFHKDGADGFAIVSTRFMGAEAAQDFAHRVAQMRRDAQ